MGPNSWDHLFRNARIATLAPGMERYGLIEKGALAVTGGRIAWIGPQSQLAGGFEAARDTDCQGALMTPGLIDCHTHLVWAGNRFAEFEQRLEGVSYEEIARQGGGINSTVRATRAASEEELFEAALGRLRRLAASGVTTVEIKSGYGLETDTECRMLRVARRLGREEPVRVHTSFLGAHAVPPEFSGRSDDYLEWVLREMLPTVAAEGLADAVDAFCEGIAFSKAQVERLFQAARALGLPVKLHAEQLSNSGGAVLAARYGALSADHLEYLDEAGVRAMAAAGSIAVLLPGAFYFLREQKVPPIEALRAHGVPIALATDLNPGSSPVHSLLLILNMACTLFRLTPLEALVAVTRNAAKALGVADEVGTLEVGKRADFVLWDVEEPAALAAQMGPEPLRKRYLGGLPDVRPGE